MILSGVFPLDESWDFDNASVNSMHHGYLEVLWMGQRNSAPVDGFCIPLFLGFSRVFFIHLVIHSSWGEGNL
jgi:hypothetical protein